jgi:hypothetical protein
LTRRKKKNVFGKKNFRKKISLKVGTIENRRRTARTATHKNSFPEFRSDNKVGTFVKKKIVKKIDRNSDFFSRERRRRRNPFSSGDSTHSNLIVTARTKMTMESTSPLLPAQTQPANGVPEDVPNDPGQVFLQWHIFDE